MEKLIEIIRQQQRGETVIVNHPYKPMKCIVRRVYWRDGLPYVIIGKGKLFIVNAKLVDKGLNLWSFFVK